MKSRIVLLLFIVFVMQQCGIFKSNSSKSNKDNIEKLCGDMVANDSSYLKVFVIGKGSSADAAKEKAQIELKKEMLIKLRGKLKPFFVLNSSNELTIPIESLTMFAQLLLFNGEKFIFNIRCQQLIIANENCSYQLFGVVDARQIVGQLQRLIEMKEILPEGISEEQLVKIQEVISY